MTNTKSRVILVVDRDSKTVLSLVGLLKLAGYNAVGAYTFDEALDVAGGVVIDLLMCEIDILSPSGVSLLDAIRNLYSIKAFGFTATGSDEDIRLSNAAGFDRLFLKPLHFDNLQGEVERVLRRHASYAASAFGGQSNALSQAPH